MEHSRATHRQGVIITQSIQKLSLWRLIFKGNCWSPVVITVWPPLLPRTRVRNEVSATHTGWTVAQAWVGAPVGGPQGRPGRGTENGQVTRAPHTCSLAGRRATGSGRMCRHARHSFQTWAAKLTPPHAPEERQPSSRLLFYLPTLSSEKKKCFYS